VHLVDPDTTEVAQCCQVFLGGQKLGLEAPHLAGGSRSPVDRMTADDPPHGGIATKTIGVVHVVVAAEPAEDGLAEQSRHAMPAILAGTTVGEYVADRIDQSKGVVEFPISEQAAVGGDPGVVEFELQSAVEIDPKRLPFRFTHRVRHDRPAQFMTTY
jgi:hypothetical protein